MKALRLAILAALMLIPALAKAQVGPVDDFTQTLSKATLEMYVGKQECKYTPFDTMFGPVDGWGCTFVSKPICTATVIRDEGQAMYAAISAGHCIVPELYKQGWKYYVGAEVSDQPVLNEIHLIKWANDDRYDFVIFDFKSVRKYPAVDINGAEDDAPAVGTEVLNCNFSLGIAKQMTEGKVLSDKIPEKGDNKGLKNRYFVNVGIGPGASGSSIVDKKTHKIVGLVEAVFPGTQMATIVISTGKNLYDFGDDDSVVEPLPPPNGEQFKMHEQKEQTVLGLLRKYFADQMKQLGL